MIGAVLIVTNYFAWRAFQKERYLTRKKFVDSLKVWSGTLLLIGIYVAALFIIGLPTQILLRVAYAEIMFFVLVFLPFLMAELVYAYSLLNKESNVLRLLKTLHPWHRTFIHRWQNANVKTKIWLLSMEPDALKLPDQVYSLLKIWTEIGEISLKSLLEFSKAKQYLFINDDQRDEDVLEIERFTIEKGEFFIKVKTHGNLVPENLLSGKSKAKIYEHFAIEERPVKSIFYNAVSRDVHVQFFLTSDGMPAEIFEIAQKLEIGFADLSIKNNLSSYPVFKDFEIVDQDDIANNKIYSVRLIYKLPAGLPNDLISKNKIENLASYIRLPLYQHRLRPYDDELELYVELANRDLSKLNFQNFPSAKGLRVALGFDLKYRKPIFINFDQAEVQDGDPNFTPHLLIAGATASGKSNFIKFLIAQLLQSHGPDSLRFFMVDPKVVTFKSFSKLPHLYAPIISEADKFQVILAGIVEEVERRYKILAENDVENIYEMLSKHPDKVKDMPRILVIVDEFADIIDSHNWNIREQIVLTLKKLGQKARAAGVHLVLITQRATSQNIDSEVKANISGRISFKVSSEGDSQVIIESPLGADLKHPGEGYARLGDSDELIHFQAPFITDEQLKEIIHRYDAVPQVFVDNTLTVELLKKPLHKEEVNLAMMPEPKFPIIPIGVNLNSHHPVNLILTREEGMAEIEPTPHLIVAGATNSGKSQLAKLLVRQLAESGGPELVKLILVDPKAVSFVQYKNLPHLACPIISKHHQLLPLIKEMMKIIEERYELFAGLEVENIEQFRKKTQQDMHSYVMIIDEFADLLDYYDFRERDEIEKMLKRFGQMARAAGVHLILITQRATSQNISGEIRANFAGRIALRMNSEADSYYILEEAGAEKISGAGVFLVKKAHYALENGYSPMLTEADIQMFVARTRTEYGEKQLFEERLEKTLNEQAEKIPKENIW